MKQIYYLILSKTIHLSFRMLFSDFTGETRKLLYTPTLLTKKTQQGFQDS